MFTAHQLRLAVTIVRQVLTFTPQQEQQHVNPALYLIAKLAILPNVINVRIAIIRCLAYLD
jgi:hypothetical protein